MNDRDQDHDRRSSPDNDRRPPSAWHTAAHRLIDAGSLLVPSDRRTEWRDEWHAEVHYRWLRMTHGRRDPRAASAASEMLGSSYPTPPGPLAPGTSGARGRNPAPALGAQLALLARTAGCLLHALWLRKEEWRLHMIWQDMRYAARALARRPVFTLVATLTLALAIGALSAIAGIVYTVLLKPLPYHEPDRLVQIWENNPVKGWTQNLVAPANLVDWRERTRTLDGIGAYYGDVGQDARASTLTLTGIGDPIP